MQHLLLLSADFIGFAIIGSALSWVSSFIFILVLFVGLGFLFVFSSDEYKRVLVVWDVQEPNVVKQAKEIYGIEVWRISDIITELMHDVGTKAYRDDILRLAQLISATK